MNSKLSQINQDLIKDYSLAKLTDSPKLNCFIRFCSYRSMVLLNSWTKGTVINNTIIISTFIGILTQWFSWHSGHKYLVGYKLATVEYN